MEAREIAERIWPGEDAAIEELGGGITNRNFKVTVGGEAFVLRVGGKDTSLLGIDRAHEHEASVAAARAGVGPEVVAYFADEGWLVTRFVEGRPIPVEELRRAPWLERVAESLAAAHAGPELPGRFDPFRVVEAYRETAERKGVAVPAAYGWAREQAEAIARVLGARPARPCHNDLLNANFIAAGERLWIVDWEYAGMGDPLFDLANFAVNHELGEAEAAALLRAYGGELDERAADDLRLLRFMSDFREAMWGVVQQGISELDFDFRAYAEEHFERLRRRADDPAFTAALRKPGGGAPLPARVVIRGSRPSPCSRDSVFRESARVVRDLREPGFVPSS